MIVINKQSSRSGLVIGETDKSYQIRAISRTDSWIPKAQCRMDFDFYEAQLAMHLTIGYVSAFSFVEEAELNIDGVAKLSAFVPALILADRKLDAQLKLGSRAWNKVFAYDVAQAAGEYLAQNPRVDIAQFTAKLEELIA